MIRALLIVYAYAMIFAGGVATLFGLYVAVVGQVP